MLNAAKRIGVSLCMKEEKKTVQRSSVAEETSFSEEALGYPLNIMCSLYYESNECGGSISCPGQKAAAPPATVLAEAEPWHIMTPHEHE